MSRMKAARSKEAMKYSAEFIASLVAGATGGWIFGFVILSFGYLIGRSGDNPNEGVGYWDPEASFLLAGFYGMPLGLIVFPVGYFLFLQKAPLLRALIFSVLGTLTGGLIGATVAAPVAAFCGVVGFFLASASASARS